MDGVTASDQPKIGMSIWDLDTPSLLVDRDAFERNVTTMATFLGGGLIQLRPHSKSHKCPTIAKQQIAAGAIGVCCQKLGEAEVMGAAGIRDILITNEIVGPIKIARLMRLARIADVNVAVDNAENARALAAAARDAGLRLGVLVEVDVGMQRCGLASREAVVELAKLIDGSDSLRFRGLFGYEGHCVDIPDFDERKAKTEEANALLLDRKSAVEAAGVAVDIVTGGGTGTYMITGRCPGYTEIEAGSYIFMDTSYRQALTDFDQSLFVLATVISHPADNRIVLDCGVKTLAGDYGTPAIRGLPAAGCGFSEEHTTWTFDGSMPNVRVGDKVLVIPAHCCATVNLHDRLYAYRGERLEEIWDVAGRGKTQ